MSDWFETLVAPQVSEADAPSKAAAVVAHLIEAGLILPGLTNCALGGRGHAPGPGLAAHLKQPDEELFALATNGMEVVAERRPHLAANVERVCCPRCGSETGRDLKAWQEALGDWQDGGEGMLLCRSCESASSVVAWRHEPPCAFGNLAFTFWNWPPFEPAHWHKTPAAFVEEVLGDAYACVVVGGKL